MPTKARLTARLQRLVRWLRKHYPTQTPVTVRVLRSQPGLHGLCLIGDGRALIRLTADTEAVMTDACIEEWCHVLRHDTPLPQLDAHDSIFWAIYGQVSVKWRGE